MAAKKPEILVSPNLRQISSKFQRLHKLFRVDASIGGPADVCRRLSLPEIQHGRQQTGNTSISESTTDIIEIPTAAQAFPARRVHCRHCRRFPSSISPGYPTWPPTNRKYYYLRSCDRYRRNCNCYTRFSGSTRPLETLPMSPDVDLSRKSNTEAKKPEALVSPKLRQISSKFQRQQPLFRGDASTGGTADVERRRSLPEIQHGRQQTGRTSISETTTHIVEIPTSTPAFPGRRVHWRHYRRRPSSISIGNLTWPPTNRKY